MFVSGDAEGPWPSGKLQLFELERSLLHSGCMLGYSKCSGVAAVAAAALQRRQHSVCSRHCLGAALPALLFPPFFLSFFLGMIVQMQH